MICGVLSYVMAILKLWNSTRLNYRLRSSLKCQTQHASPLTTHQSKITRKHKLHWKGKKRCTLHQNQPFEIIRTNSEHKAMTVMITTGLCLIKYWTQKLRNTTQYTSVGVGMVSIRYKKQEITIEGWVVSIWWRIPQSNNLSHNLCLFLIKLYIDTILFPQTKI